MTTFLSGTLAATGGNSVTILVVAFAMVVGLVLLGVIALIAKSTHPGSCTHNNSRGSHARGSRRRSHGDDGFFPGVMAGSMITDDGNHHGHHHHHHGHHGHHHDTGTHSSSDGHHGDAGGGYGGDGGGAGGDSGGGCGGDGGGGGCGGGDGGGGGGGGGGE